MVGKQVAQLVWGLIPVIMSVASGHESDLNKAADIFQGVADQLRVEAAGPQPLP